jgi:Subtilase family
MPEPSTPKRTSPLVEDKRNAYRLLSAVWLLILPALLLPAPASAAGPGISINGEVRSAAGTVVQPVRMRRRAWMPRRAQSRGRHGHHAHGEWGDTSSRPPRDPPPRRPHRHAHRHRPHLPPLPYYPWTVEERAEYLASLPRHSQQAPQGQSQVFERQIVLLFNTDRSLSVRDQVARTHGLERLRGQALPLLNAQMGLFRIRGGRSGAAVLAALQQDGRVRAAQLNQRYLHTQGAGRQPAAIPQYGPLKVSLPEAHRLALGRKVIVAVIDSRVDATHPDLKGAVVRAYDAAGGADKAPDFHGTAVAGIIRGRGIMDGVAPEAEILAVRAFRVGRPGTLPDTDTYTLLGGIDWAVRNGARILNMSFTGPRDAALQQALEAAGRKGVILVAAAGNAGPEAPPAFPAAYPGVIAVTAVDEADRRYVHANRGSYIAVAAPGVDILAPVELGRHSYLSGTSFAAAYVSGIAALLLERDPHLGTAALAKVIAAGADDLGPAGRDDDFGAGRVNAFSSLRSMPAGLATR